MAVFEVTDKTILKILVRRGLDSERQQVRLDEGELGYTIDTKRLFVGDGLGGGGNVTGNVYQGTVADAFTVLAVVPGIQFGDLMYDTSESTLFVVNDEESSTLFDIGPRYEENVLEKTTSDIGHVRIAEPCLGKFFAGGEDRRKAFFLDYSIQEPFYKTNKVIEMNTQYWAITSGSGFNTAVGDGSFYFGDIKANSTFSPNILSSRINIDVKRPNDRIHRALTIWGVNGKEISFGASGEIGNAKGRTDFIGLSGIAFHPNTEFVNDSNPAASYSVFFAPNKNVQFTKAGGNVIDPSFSVNGFARFNESAQINGNLVIQGNLSAYGDFSVFETYLTVNSALSVVNFTENQALFVKQYNVNHPVVKTHPSTNNRVFLQDEDGDFLMGWSWYYNNGKASPTPSFLAPQTFAGESNFIVSSNFIVRDGNEANTTAKNSRFTVNIRDYIDLIGSNISVLDNSGGHIFSRNYTSRANSINANGDIANDISNSVIAVNADQSGGGFSGSGIRIRGAQTTSNSLIQLSEQVNTGGAGQAGGYYILGTTKSGGSDVTKFSVRTNGDIHASGNLFLGGNIFASGDIVAYYSSDLNIKENIKPIDNALDKLSKIKGVTFNWNDQYQDIFKIKNDVGVIAQDVEAVLPEATKTRDSGIKAVNYDKLIPLLIESVKELNNKISKLENK